MFFLGGKIVGKIIGDTIKDNIAYQGSKLIAKEVIKNSDTSAGELLRIIDDGKEEIKEVCTDGFNEMVIKGNTDYKTSFEIKEEADEKIAKSKTEFEKIYNYFNIYIEELNNRINTLYEKKIELAKMINKTVMYMPNMPQITLENVTPEYNYKPSTVTIIKKIYGIDDMSDIRGRKQSAEEYLEDAKDYEVEVAKKIAEIYRVKLILDSININLSEEEILILELNLALIENKDLQYDEIAGQLYILISEYILDVNGEKNQAYMEAIKQLKKLCK